jgi:hypothetical protein
MHLESSGLPAMGIHKRQFLSKGAVTIFAFETASKKMYEALFATHIQMTDTTMLFLMNVS